MSNETIRPKEDNRRKEQERGTTEVTVTGPLDGTWTADITIGSSPAPDTGCSTPADSGSGGCDAGSF